MRLPCVALLLTVVLASCGGSDPPRAAPASSLDSYSERANELCGTLGDAVQRTFADAPTDPVAALARYARDVHDAGKRFSEAQPPRSLLRFHAAAVRHLALESATLRRAAELSAAGDPAAALRALHVTGLLPEAIPEAVLRRAPACRGGVVPATPAEPSGRQV